MKPAKPPRPRAPPTPAHLLAPLPTSHDALRDRWSECYTFYSQLFAKIQEQKSKTERVLRKRANAAARQGQGQGQDSEFSSGAEDDIMSGPEIEQLMSSYKKVGKQLENIKAKLGLSDSD
jgi:hypothetical protein